MSITIESDLKEILTRLEQKIDNVTKDVNHLNVTLVRVEAELKGDIKVLNETIIGTKAELKGDIKALDEKVDGLSKRLETTEFVNRGILIGLIVAILGGFAKLFGIVGNP